MGIKKGDIADNVFIVGDPARAIRVSKEFDTIECEISNREYLTFTGTYKGIPVSVIGTGIGTDNVEIALVEAFIANKLNMAHFLIPIPLWMRYNNDVKVKVMSWAHTNGSAIVVGKHGAFKVVHVVD